MAERPTYPRINCCIKGCKRGTTKVEPGVRVICGTCWSRAPKEMRKQASRWRARANRFAKRHDFERAEIAGLWANRVFDNIRKLLNGEAEPCTGIPPLMAEQLRKDGLL